AAEILNAVQGTHLVTWQVLLAQARATFDPGVRPLLAHAERLSYLQPPEKPGYDDPPSPGW
ncbi:MAG: hypothetical protein JXA89_18120, partial [Anaerolineae bacterium]|nr:hypothetical protein [Anaerolineae bacterium]